MFDIGFAELLIIAVVALLVLGPEKLPTAVRTLGLWVGKFRRTVSGIQAEISEELRLDELRRNASIEKERLDRELDEMKTPFQSTSRTSPNAGEGQGGASDTPAAADPKAADAGAEKKADT